MMRLFEFADAEAQVALWKLISDSVWTAIDAERQKQAQASTKKAVKKPKSAPRRKKAKRAPTPPPAPPPAKAKPMAKPKPPEDGKTTQAAAATPPAKKLKVLPRVFSSAAKSDLDASQTPVTTATSLDSVQTTPDRLADRPGSTVSN